MDRPPERATISATATFQQALGGTPVAIGDPVRNRRDGEWVSSDRASDHNPQTGEVQAVLLTRTLIAKFQDAMRADHLPIDRLPVKSSTIKGRSTAAFPETPNWIGHTPSHLDVVSSAFSRQGDP